MRIRNILLAAALLLSAFTIPASAADFAAIRFPKGFGMALSVRSSRELIQSIDDFAVACSEGTPKAVPPGIISAQLFRNLPFLKDMNLQAHLYMPPSATYAALFNHLIVLGNADFEQIVAAFGMLGIDVVKSDAGKYHSLKGRGKRSIPYLLQDMGEGYIAIAPNPNMLGMISREFDKGWRPALWATGDVGILIDQPGKWAVTTDNINVLTGLAGMWLAEEGSKKLTGVNIAVLARLLDMVSESIADIDGEFESVKRLAYEAGIDGDKAFLGFRILSDKDSFLGRAGAKLSAAGPLDSPLMRTADDDAYQMLAIAGYEDIAPGFNDLLGEVIARLGEGVFPEQKEALLTGYKAYAASGPGEMVILSGSAVNPLDMALYVRAAKPQIFLDARADMAKAGEGMTRALFPGLVSDKPTVTVKDGTTADGIPYKRIEWDDEFQLRYQELLGLKRRGRPTLPEGEEMLRKMASTAILAAGDGFILSMPGELNEERLARAIKGEPARNPLLDTPAAKAILGQLGARQGAVGLVDINRLFQSFVASVARMEGERRGVPAEEIAEKLEQFRAGLKRSDILSGFALGGENGCIVGSAVVPASAINTFVHNIDMLDSVKLGGGNVAGVKAALKNYASAQLIFQVGKQGRVAANTGTGERGFADNFRNLYFGEAFGSAKDGKPGMALELVSERMANAYAGPTAGAPTLSVSKTPAASAQPYEGYLFLEPPGVDFTSGFVLVAYPAKYGTGDKIFLIDQESMLYEMVLDKRDGGMPRSGVMPSLVTADERREVNPELWVLAE